MLPWLQKLSRVIADRGVTVVMQVLAGRHGGTASVIVLAAVHRGNHFFQTLDSISHVPLQALALTLVLNDEKKNQFSEFSFSCRKLMCKFKHRLCRISFLFD